MLEAKRKKLILYHDNKVFLTILVIGTPAYKKGRLKGVSRQLQPHVLPEKALRMRGIKVFIKMMPLFC